MTIETLLNELFVLDDQETIKATIRQYAKDNNISMAPTQKTEQGCKKIYCQVIIKKYILILKKLQFVVFSLKIFPFVCAVCENISIVHDKYYCKKKNNN